MPKAVPSNQKQQKPTRIEFQPFQTEAEFRAYFADPEKSKVLPANLDQPGLVYVDLETKVIRTLSFIEAAALFDIPEILKIPLSPYEKYIQSTGILFKAILTHSNNALQAMIANLPSHWFEQYLSEGQNALQYAARYANLDALKLLLAVPSIKKHINDLNADVTALGCAIENCSADAARILVDHGASPHVCNSANRNKPSAFQMAAIIGDTALLDALNGTVPPLQTRDKNFERYVSELTKVIREIYALSILHCTEHMSLFDYAFTNEQSLKPHDFTKNDLTKAQQLIQSEPLLLKLIQQEFFSSVQKLDPKKEIDDANPDLFEKISDQLDISREQCGSIWQSMQDLERDYKALDFSYNNHYTKLLRTLKMLLQKTDYFRRYRQDSKNYPKLIAVRPSKKFMPYRVYDFEGKDITDHFKDDAATRVILHSLDSEAPLVIPAEDIYFPRYFYQGFNEFPFACAKSVKYTDGRVLIAFNYSHKITCKLRPSVEELKDLGFAENDIRLLINFFEFHPETKNLTINFPDGLKAAETSSDLFHKFSNALTHFLQFRSDEVAEKDHPEMMRRWKRTFVFKFWEAILKTYELKAYQADCQEIIDAAMEAASTPVETAVTEAVASAQYSEATAEQAAVLPASRAAMACFKNDEAFYQYAKKITVDSTLPLNIDSPAFTYQTDKKEVSVSFAEAAAWYNCWQVFATDLTPHLEHLRTFDILGITIRTQRHESFETLVAQLQTVPNWFESLTQNGVSPLHIAAQYHNHSAARILLNDPAIRARINDCDDAGHTPLAHAIMNRDEEMIALLMKHGAKPHLINKKHPNTPSAFTLATIIGEPRLFMAMDGGEAEILQTQSTKEYAAYAKKLKKLIVEIYGMSILVTEPFAESSLYPLLSSDDTIAPPIQRSQSQIEDLFHAKNMFLRNPHLNKLGYGYLLKPLEASFLNLATDESRKTLLMHAQDARKKVLECLPQLRADVKNVDFSYAEKTNQLNLELKELLDNRRFFQAYRNDLKNLPEIKDMFLPYEIGNNNGIAIGYRYGLAYPTLITLHSLDIHGRLNLPVDNTKALAECVHRINKTFMMSAHCAMVYDVKNVLQVVSESTQITCKRLPPKNLSELGITKAHCELLNDFFNQRPVITTFNLSLAQAKKIAVKYSLKMPEFQLSLNAFLELYPKATPAQLSLFMEGWEDKFDLIFWQSVIMTREVQAFYAAKLADLKAKSSKENFADATTLTAATTSIPATPTVSPSETSPTTTHLDDAIVITPSPMKPSNDEPDAEASATNSTPKAQQKPQRTYSEEKELKAARARINKKSVAVESLPETAMQMITQIKRQFSILTALHSGQISSQAQYTHLAIQIMYLYLRCLSFANTNPLAANLLNGSVSINDFVTLLECLKSPGPEQSTDESVETFKTLFPKLALQFRNLFAQVKDDGMIVKNANEANAALNWSHHVFTTNIENLLDVIDSQSQYILDTVTDAQGTPQLQWIEHATNSPSFHVIRGALFELLSALYDANLDFNLTTSAAGAQNNFALMFGRNTDQTDARTALLDTLTEALATEPNAGTLETMRALIAGIHQATLTKTIVLPEEIAQKCKPLRDGLEKLQHIFEKHKQMPNEMTSAKLSLQMMYVMSQLVCMSNADLQVAALLNQHLDSTALEAMRNWVQAHVQFPIDDDQLSVNEAGLQTFDALFQQHLQPLLNAMLPSAPYETVTAFSGSAATDAPTAIQSQELVSLVDLDRLLICIGHHAAKVLPELANKTNESSFSILRMALFVFLRQIETIKTNYTLNHCNNQKVQECFDRLFAEPGNHSKVQIIKLLRELLTEEPPSKRSLNAISWLAEGVTLLTPNNTAEAMVDAIEVRLEAVAAEPTPAAAPVQKVAPQFGYFPDDPEYIAMMAFVSGDRQSVYNALRFSIDHPKAKPHVPERGYIETLNFANKP